MLEVHMNVI